MKNVFFSLFCLAFCSQLFAQNDSIIPKWNVGFEKKIYYTASTPQKDEFFLGFDTSRIILDWKIVSEEDGGFTFSIFPASTLNFQTEDADDYATVIDKLKEANVTFLYKVNKNGALLTQVEKDEKENALLLGDLFVESKYFINYEELKKYFKSEDSLNLTGEENQEISLEDDYSEGFDDSSLELASMVKVLEKILENVHLMMGEPYYLDSIIDMKEISEEELDKYQNGLSAMSKMLDMKGNIQVVKEGDFINYKTNLSMDMGNFLLDLAYKIEEAFKDENKKLSKKEKKEQAAKKEEMKNIQMEIQIYSQYYFSLDDYIPVKARTEITSNVSNQKDRESYTGWYEIVIE